MTSDKDALEIFEGLMAFEKQANDQEMWTALERGLLKWVFDNQEKIRAALSHTYNPETHILIARDYKLTREVGDKILDAMWPSGEVIFDDAFPGPEHQLSQGVKSFIAALIAQKLQE